MATGADKINGPISGGLDNLRDKIKELGETATELRLRLQPIMVPDVPDVADETEPTDPHGKSEKASRNSPVTHDLQSLIYRVEGVTAQLNSILKHLEI